MGRLALATAHPRWIADAFADALGPVGGPDAELPVALAADDAAPSVHLVARPGLIDRDELVRRSGGAPARFSPYGVYLDHGDPGRLAPVADGRAAVQDEGSQLVAIALATAALDGRDGTVARPGRGAGRQGRPARRAGRGARRNGGCHRDLDRTAPT